METQIVTFKDGRKAIVGMDTDGSIIAQPYTEGTPLPTEGKPAPAGVKDKVGLSDWLQGQGFKRGSLEYDLKFKEMAQGLPLLKLTDKISL